jgi:3-oxoadipate enol-lactonase
MTTRTTQAPGINWLAAGAGPALVFVHGAGGNAAAWFAQMEAFADTHRVIAYDLPGFGRSAQPGEGAYHEHFAKTAVSVMDATGVEKATLICQSLGGWTGVRLALECPERIERLVLSCTMAGIAHPPAIQSLRVSVSKMDARGPASIALSDSFRSANPARAYLYEQLTAFNPALDPLLAQKLVSAQILIPPDRLKAITCPTLVLAGELDPIWPPSTLEGIAGLLPNALYKVFPGSGHSPYFEQPEAFNEALRAFIAGPA